MSNGVPYLTSPPATVAPGFPAFIFPAPPTFSTLDSLSGPVIAAGIDPFNVNVTVTAPLVIWPAPGFPVDITGQLQFEGLGNGAPGTEFNVPISVPGIALATGTAVAISTTVARPPAGVYRVSALLRANTAGVPASHLFTGFIEGLVVEVV